MFCLYTSSKLSCPEFEFSLKVKVIGLNTGYLLKSFLLYQGKKNMHAFSENSKTEILTEKDPKSVIFSYIFVAIKHGYFVSF